MLALRAHGQLRNAEYHQASIGRRAAQANPKAGRQGEANRETNQVTVYDCIKEAGAILGSQCN
jgi:hypothetical protein